MDSTKKSIKLLVATSNEHKLEEMRSILSDSFQLIGMKELGYTDEIPELANTLSENALIKARYLFTKTQCSCIADDSGLEVDALGGAPGVYSARYAGPRAGSLANLNLLFENMNGVVNRSAQFRTVIALIWNGKEYLFEGIVKGNIASEISGTFGFGYDPIFIPQGWSETFADASPEIKNQMSHRALAMYKLRDFLSQTQLP